MNVSHDHKDQLSIKLEKQIKTHAGYVKFRLEP